MKIIKSGKPRSLAGGEALEQDVKKIITDVRAGGDRALASYNRRFDECERENYRVTKAEIQGAYGKLSPEEVNDLKSAAENIRLFATTATSIGVIMVHPDDAAAFSASLSQRGSKLVMFRNLADDPVIERIATSCYALTAAEYLAFDLGMHVLVIVTDLTSYCEALRELSVGRGEIPSRKRYPIEDRKSVV